LFTADEATSVAATIIEEVVNGDEKTFTLESNGYSVIEGGYDDAKPNVIKVTINTVTSVIVKVEVVEMNDTKGIGDKAEHEVFLSQFVGLN
jgi:hypothetical protein